ncbi:MAG: PASTA domain-containing protein [Vicinamibacterales bacterium]
MSDGRGGSATQSFSIVVPQVSTNRPPTAVDDHYVVPVGQTMNVPASGLLNNDSDPDGDPITASPLAGSAPDKGTLSGPNPDGSFTYVAPSGPTGPPFQPVVRYKARMDGGYLGHYEVDVTGDGVRDVVVKTFGGFAAFDGPTGTPLWSFAGGFGGVLPAPYTQPCRASSDLEGWAVGDIDDDGIPEVVTTANCDPSVYDDADHLMAFDARTGAEKWVSQRLSVTRNPAAPGVGFTYTNPGAASAAGVTIARLTPNDVPVILFGNSSNANDCSLYVEQAPTGVVDCRRVTIVNGPTGAKRRTMYSIGAAINNRAANGDRNEQQNFQPPIVFDLDRDGEVEIVYGGVVFALDGSPKWELPVGTPHIAIGNLDDTPDVEVVAITRLAPYGRLGNLEAYKSDGTLLWRYPLGNGATNLFTNLTVADVDGDGFADVLFPYFDYGLGLDMLLAVGHDGRLKWLTAGPATAYGPGYVSARSRVAVFDLDGDGVPEVIKQHTDALYFLNGVDGSVKATVPFAQFGDAGGSRFVPSVADLDGDGRAEVVIVNAGLFQPDYGIWVLTSGGSPWRGVTGGLSQMSSGGAAVSVSGRVPLDYGNPFADRRTNVFGTVAPEPLPGNGNKPNQTSFLYTVSDGSLSSVAKVTIDIAPSNRPPVFTSTPPQVYTPFSGFSYAAFAVDPDAGDTVTYRLGAVFDQDFVALGGPGCSINAASGLLSCGFMDYNSSKSPLVQFLIIATDGHGASSSQLVSVVPSTGAPRVPNVIGQQQAAAVAAVTNVGLQVWAVFPVPSAFPAGQVISQTPAGGTVVPAGGIVSLVVSAGPPPAAVPNVVGQTQAAAQGQLVNARLTLGAVTLATSATVPAGEVIAQTPTAGSSAAPGSAVDLVVSRGNGLLASLATSIVNAGDPVNVRVQVVDTAGTPIVPTPAVTIDVLGQTGEFSGPLPIVAGAQVTTVSATRGLFTVRVTELASGAVVDLPLVVTNDTSSGTQQVVFSQLGAAVQRTTETIEALASAVAANDLAAIQTLKNTLQATRNGLDLEDLRRSTPFAPTGGFLPTPAQLDAAGYHEAPVDAQWAQALTDANAKFAEVEAYVRQMRLVSPVNDDVRLASCNAQLESVITQVEALTPTLHGTVKYGSLMNHLLSVRVPRLLDAQLERLISTLQQQGLAASARPALDGYLAALDASAPTITPSAFYAQAVATDYSLAEVAVEHGHPGPAHPEGLRADDGPGREEQRHHGRRQPAADLWRHRCPRCRHHHRVRQLQLLRPAWIRDRR